jgi:hypothetical protein
MKASALYRIAAVLLLLFDAGHTSGFPWSDPVGEWIFVPCVQLTFTLWGLGGLIWDFYPPSGVKLRPSERRYKPYIVVLLVRLGTLPARQLPGRFAIRSLTGPEA